MEETSEYKVQLDVFEGPLDLLLHLIKEQQLNIYDIPIAKVTEQYIAYIELMKALNLDIAGEFLVMAATLMHIKSKMLLPREETLDQDDEDGEDPRAGLVAKLIEYQRFKEAAAKLREREFVEYHIYTRGTPAELPEQEGDLLQDVTIFELLSALKRVIDSLPGGKMLDITADEISVVDRINHIMEKLEEAERESAPGPDGQTAGARILFTALFGSNTSVPMLIATFLALLELMKQKFVRVRQSGDFGEIYIYKAVQDDTLKEVDDTGADALAASGAISQIPEDMPSGAVTFETPPSGTGGDE